MEALHLEKILWIALSIGLRISAVMLFAPFFDSQAIPMQVKAGFTVALTALLYPVAQSAFAMPPEVNWPQLLLGEFGVGLLLGLTLQLVVEAAITAGQLMGVQAGYSLVTLLDPQTQADTPVMGTLNQMVTLVIFLQLNVHHWLLRGLAASFSYAPPGAVLWRGAIGEVLLRDAGGIWLAAVQIAAPVIVATMLVDITMGFLAKAAPQIPVLFLGLPIKNVLSLLALTGGLTLWPRFFEQHFAHAIAMGEQLLHLAR
jgi:flagellar biosynthesis protein FliR